ncbi:MAG: hypothetical protein GIKADHBN_02346 [Phycisphaerales bacterium]|nr:hypothetical protein [Phycisphaerales bacterium]
MKLALDSARLALRRAMEVRKRAGIPMDHALSVLDLAALLDVEVWFMPLPSLAGMYSGPPTPMIVIGSDRPSGFQNSTGAHELGHHIFGHGSRVDEYVESRSGMDTDPDETLADMFAAHLLMPQAAVTRAFRARSWDISSPDADQILIAAGQLGVGYSALVHHLRWTIRAITPEVFDRLIGVAPRDIRARILGRPVAEDLVVADRFWSDRAIDLVVGDLAILPAECLVEGRAVRVIAREHSHVLVQAVRRGLARADRWRDDWSAFLRVMPRQYEGAAVYRHLEDPDDE